MQCSQEIGSISGFFYRRRGVEGVSGYPEFDPGDVCLQLTVASFQTFHLPL